jgi:hypothetical protein
MSPWLAASPLQSSVMAVRQSLVLLRALPLSCDALHSGSMVDGLPCVMRSPSIYEREVLAWMWARNLELVPRIPCPPAPSSIPLRQLARR